MMRQIPTMDTSGSTRSIHVFGRRASTLTNSFARAIKPISPKPTTAPVCRGASGPRRAPPHRPNSVASSSPKAAIPAQAAPPVGSNSF